MCPLASWWATNPDCYVARVSVRVLIYLRVSDDAVGQRVSVTSQDKEIREFCALMNWTVVGVIVDNDRSASRYRLREREGFQRLPQALSGGTAEFGRVDALASWEASRNQRDLEDYVVLRNLCTDHSVKLAYKGRVYDLTDSRDRFSTGMDALLAEREADDIRDRILRGIRTKAAKGEPHGHVGYGYRRRYGEHSRRLLGQEVDEITAAVVREMAARIVSGESLYGIAHDLNARGVPTPMQHKDALMGRTVERGGWSSSKIRRVLSQRGLTGHREHLGVVHPEQTWPAVLTVEVWEQVQAVLADPHRARHHGGVDIRYLLSGIATCGPCGAWLRPARNRGRLVYQCAGHGDGRGKGHVSRPMEPVEAKVVVHVLHRLADPDFLVELRQAEGGDVAVAQRELDGLVARLTALEDDAVAGRLTGAAFGRMEKRLVAAIEDARLRARPRSVPSLLLDVAGPDAKWSWDRLDLHGQRQIIRFMVTVTVRRASTSKGSRTFDPSTIEIVDLT